MSWPRTWAFSASGMAPGALPLGRQWRSTVFFTCVAASQRRLWSVEGVARTCCGVHGADGHHDDEVYAHQQA